MMRYTKISKTHLNRLNPNYDNPKAYLSKPTIICIQYSKFKINSIKEIIKYHVKSTFYPICELWPLFLKVVSHFDKCHHVQKLFHLFQQLWILRQFISLLLGIWQNILNDMTLQMVLVLEIWMLTYGTLNSVFIDKSLQNFFMLLHSFFIHFLCLWIFLQSHFLQEFLVLLFQNYSVSGE